MRGKGNIRNFERLVISDPHYDPKVWCRYDKKLDKIEDWEAHFIIRDYEDEVEMRGQKLKLSGIEYSVLMKRPNAECELLDVGSVGYKRGAKLKKYEIGVDTAQVAFGVNEKAEEINNYAKEINNSSIGELLSDYNPKFAIQTNSDGKYGTVQEGIVGNKTQFIILNGYFDSYADVQSVEELKDYFKKQFNIENMEVEQELKEIEEIEEDDMEM